MTLYLNGTTGISGVDGSAGTPAVQGTDTNTGISFPAADTIAFNEGGAEVGRFDSSGRLLVGTSSGSHPLSVVSSQSSKIQFGQASDQGGFLFSDGAGAFGIAGGGYFNGSNWIAKHTASSHIRDDGDANIRFFTNSSLTAGNTFTPTERMRIRADGGVSSYAPSGTTWDLRWNGDTDQVRSIQIIGGASGILSGGTERLRIWNNGDAQNRAGVWGSLSDAKLKTNITDAASQWDDIKSLRVRKYNLLDDLEHAHIGVIAQELELTSPGLVTSHPDLDESGCETGEYTKAVKNSILYMKAMKALQEAMERIEQLEAKVAALESA